MSMRGKRRFYTVVGFVALAGALGAVTTVLDGRVAVQGGAAVQAPMFEVDPLWPKPLPNNWAVGNGIGIAIDQLLAAVATRSGPTIAVSNC